MKFALTIDLPEDFKHLYEIFDFNPEQIIQRFVNEVSFPVFYSNRKGAHLWATFFFLDFMKAAGAQSIEKSEHFEPFMDRIAKSITKEQTKGESSIRKIMTEWHRDVLRNRSEDMLNRLKDGDDKVR